MAIIRQQNWLGQQRVDVPDLRSLESGVAADFDILAGKMISGRTPLVVRGFTVPVTGVAGSPADSLQLTVAGGLLMHFGASEAGTLFSVNDGASAEALSSTNSKVSGAFTASSTNYVGLDLQRNADTSTTDLKQFLDADTLLEIAKSVPTARTLNYKIIISTQPFSVNLNICPIAKVITNSSNAVISITDARQMMFRLGRGGDVPSGNSSFTWVDTTRTENPISYSPPTSSTNPFGGGDKEILSLKQWMDAIMSRLWEFGGGQYWYSATTRDNVKIAFGTPVIPATGDNFQWDSGTNTLTWQSLSVLFENSTAYYNTIQNGSAVLSADGQCLYVDLVRETNGATLVPAVATLTSLGSPNIPGARFVFAWRANSQIQVRDKTYEVGRTFPVATTAVLGTVKLNQIAGTPGAPVVTSIMSNGQVEVTATANNSHAFKGTSNGSGPAFLGIGGTTGAGGDFTGGATSGSGIIAQATGSSKSIVARGSGSTVLSFLHSDTINAKAQVGTSTDHPIRFVANNTDMWEITGGVAGVLQAVGGNRFIRNVQDPSGAQDAATKAYVDAHTSSCIIAFGASSAGASAGTTFMRAWGSSQTDSVAEIAQIPVPFAGTIRNFYAHYETGSVTQNRVFTVRKNGVDTTLTCTVSASNANDTTHSFTVVAGDLISVKCVVGSGNGNTGSWYLTMELYKP